MNQDGSNLLPAGRRPRPSPAVLATSTRARAPRALPGAPALRIHLEYRGRRIPREKNYSFNSSATRPPRTPAAL